MAVSASTAAADLTGRPKDDLGGAPRRRRRHLRSGNKTAGTCHSRSTARTSTSQRRSLDGPALARTNGHILPLALALTLRLRPRTLPLSSPALLTTTNGLPQPQPPPPPPPPATHHFPFHPLYRRQGLPYAFTLPSYLMTITMGLIATHTNISHSLAVNELLSEARKVGIGQTHLLSFVGMTGSQETPRKLRQFYDPVPKGD
ncbi:hypothetical protein K435DRAFT_850661 [Dendrothele bispora CBS 962.96]|uniref:Uncharacterized protein n=1 Tax=Dendrothele bispora (strain CBS 962.96) TaxID=1314807 RepID=A0A4S8MP30_DENBC|nr:hypothetical protein K435DRAFT_850661 [Dendrothele bispora CBS 962.96]